MKKYNILIKKGSDLSQKEFVLLAKETQRIFYGEGNYEKELTRLKKEKNSLFFLLKYKRKLLAFGFLKPTKIKYKNKSYNIFGIRNIIATESNKGYGTILMKNILTFIEDSEKTGLGFTGSRVAKFYRERGFKVKANLRKRFYSDYNSFSHWGFYIEGKDKFISEVLKTKSKLDMPFKEW